MELIISSVFSFFLLFTRDYIIFLLSIFGIIFVDRRLFLRTTILILFGLILNIYLKSLFQVPLKPHLGNDWWAFPSGHTQFAATFYGYLAYSYQDKLIKILCFGITVLVACALVYFNFHDWIDVIAAFGVAALLIIMFDKISKFDLFVNRLYLLSACLLALSCFLLTFISKKGASLPLILGSHIGLTIGLFIENIASLKDINKILEVCLLIVGGVLLYILFPLLPLSKMIAPYVLYGGLVCWAVCGPRLMRKII